MDRGNMLDLLDELVRCHSPAGQEAEIDAVIRREFEALGVAVRQDEAGNLVAHLDGVGPRVMVVAHKDEIGMAVSAVREDGRLSVENCGGARPWKYGEGPIDLLTDSGDAVRGVLSVGSVHTKTGTVPQLDRDRALTWDLVSVFTGLSAAELAAKGIHVGSRVVVAKERKGLQRLGDYVAAFALDDRMGVVAMIAALSEMAKLTPEERPDLYCVAAHGEEVGFLGAVYAAQQIRPSVCIALDTSPVAHGTPVELDPRPVIWYKEQAYHNKDVCDRLLALADELGFSAQACMYAASASDAGRIKELGLAGKTACFGFARDNSHGFEITHRDSIVNVAGLLTAYLKEV